MGNGDKGLVRIREKYNKVVYLIRFILSSFTNNNSVQQPKDKFTILSQINKSACGKLGISKSLFKLKDKVGSKYCGNVV